MDTWPIDLLVPRDPHWRLVGAAISGGQPVVGPPRYANRTGGPYWLCDHGGVWARRADQVKTARALQAIADGGSTQFIVSSCEGRLVPGSPTPAATVPHSDGAPFSDSAEYSQSTLSGTVAASAALRATTLQITLPAGVQMDVCDVSIDHPTKGPRRYRAMRVLEQSGQIATVSIRPPLREAVVGGEEVEMANPRCVMVLVNADDFISALQGNRWADLNPQFAEAP